MADSPIIRYIIEHIYEGPYDSYSDVDRNLPNPTPNGATWTAGTVLYLRNRTPLGLKLSPRGANVALKWFRKNYEGKSKDGLIHLVGMWESDDGTSFRRIYATKGYGDIVPLYKGIA